MKKSSQIQPVGATALPDRVSVAMTEIAENMHEGLLALAVPSLRAALEREIAEPLGPDVHNDEVSAA